MTVLLSSLILRALSRRESSPPDTPSSSIMRATLALRREQGRRYCNVPPYGTRWQGKRAVEDELEQKLFEVESSNITSSRA